MTAEPIHLWVKLSYTAFLCVLVPVYWSHYGPKNFLWFSDIALFATGAALWLESSLVASMMAVAVLLPETAWNADFIVRLATGRSPFRLSEYMFDRRNPAYLRALSLFHVPLPIVLVWLVHRLGYDRRAWLLQTVLAAIVLPVTYWLTDPAENVNWVHGLGVTPERRLPPRLYVALLVIGFSLVLYLPVHLVLRPLFGTS